MTTVQAEKIANLIQDCGSMTRVFLFSQPSDDLLSGLRPLFVEIVLYDILISQLRQSKSTTVVLHPSKTLSLQLSQSMASTWNRDIHLLSDILSRHTGTPDLC